MHLRSFYCFEWVCVSADFDFSCRYTGRVFAAFFVSATFLLAQAGVTAP